MLQIAAPPPAEDDPPITGTLAELRNSLERIQNPCAGLVGLAPLVTRRACVDHDALGAKAVGRSLDGRHRTVASAHDAGPRNSTLNRRKGEKSIGHALGKTNAQIWEIVRLHAMCYL